MLPSAIVRRLKMFSLCWRLLDEGLKKAALFAWLCESDCACEIQLVSHTDLQSDSIPACSGRGTQKSAAAPARTHTYYQTPFGDVDLGTRYKTTSHIPFLLPVSVSEPPTWSTSLLYHFFRQVQNQPDLPVFTPPRPSSHTYWAMWLTAAAASASAGLHFSCVPLLPLGLQTLPQQQASSQAKKRHAGHLERPHFDRET